ncbi:(-)-germacrene D synthase-like [Alnus glutinosa]|uniref:(-)-germacrene D synthase-like n=1 Tax=Alnus glutinosa TaxID=3517 RepID=UPI002D778116|nr:(-)-germacrene D synthase-like [Alnus glutinosa]
MYAFASTKIASTRRTCRPVVDFMVKVLYASFTFQISELVTLYQGLEDRPDFEYGFGFLLFWFDDFLRVVEWVIGFLLFKFEAETDEKTKQQVQELKMLMAPSETSPQKLKLIDAIQRLGVSYHFETEIQNFLEQLHKTLHDCDHDHEDDDDLYTVALRFRLLRQHGYYISCDMFTKFRDNNGNFRESPINDPQGMLSLYEATHLRVHGEDILDEALVFNATHLESIASHLSPPLAAQVSHALKHLTYALVWTTCRNFSNSVNF